MAGLAAQLEALIAAQGPIPVSRYMAEALYHPRDGYYMSMLPFGSLGDYITAPEVSQMFGELVGLWCVDSWRRLDIPLVESVSRDEPPLLIELGPGRGTMMADILRTTRRFTPFQAALIEISPHLRGLQRNALHGLGVEWHDTLEKVPAAPFVLVANELFDALPIHQFVRLRDGWHERMVGRGPDGGLAFVAAPDTVPLGLDANEGDVAETCPAGEALMMQIAERVVRDRGVALVIDYGRAETGPGASLQGIKRHQPHPVLDMPGSADLTAHVDFAALVRAARAAGAEVHGPTTQGHFLMALGLAERAGALHRTGAENIEAAVERLASPQQMGTLFKVLAVVPPGFGPPAGF